MTRSWAELRPLCVDLDATVRDALVAIDRGAAGVCLLIDADTALVGLITDGDARRAVLGGTPLDASALAIATHSPHVAGISASRAHVLDLMRAMRVSVIPVLDARGRVVGLHTLSGIVGKQTLPNAAVVMAGGRGTRLGELTDARPKPLMTVAGRTILEWVVLNLVGGGIRTIYVSVNYLAEQVEEHLEDGSQLGCSVQYLRESNVGPLGTAGSLGLLHAQRSELVEPVIVTNGDLMTQFSVQALLATHTASGAAVTVGVRDYEHQVPFGVVTVGQGGELHYIEEKPTWRASINAGVYAVSPSVLARVPLDQPSTMLDLVATCLEDGMQVGTWTLESDWIDVGTPGDLARAKGQQ